MLGSVSLMVSYYWKSVRKCLVTVRVFKSVFLLVESLNCLIIGRVLRSVLLLVDFLDVSYYW